MQTHSELNASKSQNSSDALITRSLNSLDFYHMLREQTMTFSRGIPELYISSDMDVLLKTSFTDWMAKFIARRRAIASNQVSFNIICTKIFDKKSCVPLSWTFYSRCSSSFRQEVGQWRRTATPPASTSRYCLRSPRTTSAAVPRFSRAALNCTWGGSSWKAITLKRAARTQVS